MIHDRLDPSMLRLDPSAFVANTATVVGEVTLGPEASVWFSAVLRGDTAAIEVGARSNIQDGAVLHVDPGQPCVVGDEVTVGHRAIVHGARVHHRALIGMGAIVMDDVEVGEACLVAAGAVVGPGKRLPAGVLVRGVPARVVRDLTAAEIDGFAEGAARYADKARAFAAGWGHPSPGRVGKPDTSR